MEPKSRSSGSGSGSGSGTTQPFFEDSLEGRRAALLRVIRFAIIAWCGFAAVDAWVAFVVDPDVPFAWFALWRVAQTLLMVAYLFAVPRVPSAWIEPITMALFLGGSAAVAAMAIRYHGIASPYAHGISLIVAIAASVFPQPWRRSLPRLLSMAVMFPTVQALAAVVDEPSRRILSSPAAWKLFALNFAFVLGMALLGTLSSHTAWLVRRQIFETRRLGKYRLKLRLDEGGMGDVWLASDVQLGRDVALKILKPEVAARPGALARFEHEAKALAALRNPHTVCLHDFGASDDGLWFLALDFVEGANLRALVEAEGPLAPARAVYLARQVAETLADAHDRGLIHRDIKPENLLVTTHEGVGDWVVLIDFGIAKIVAPDLDVTMTQDGFRGGTPAYMAPEVLAAGTADARSDIYSLGCVLYFLLTATPPFPGSEHAAVMAGHLHGKVEPPSQRVTGIPPSLDKIVLRCLAKEPIQRFQRASELADALATCGLPEWKPAPRRVLTPRPARPSAS